MSDELWYVVHVRSQMESMAQDSLLRCGYSVIRPLVSQFGRVSSMFPGYLFVADDEDLGLSLVNRAWGVIRLLGGSSPQPVHPAIMLAILARLDDYGVMPLNVFGSLLERIFPGDEVLIASGVAEGLSGICQWVTDRRVAVMLYDTPSVVVQTALSNAVHFTEIPDD